MGVVVRCPMEPMLSLGWWLRGAVPLPVSDPERCAFALGVAEREDGGSGPLSVRVEVDGETNC